MWEPTYVGAGLPAMLTPRCISYTETMLSLASQLPHKPAPTVHTALLLEQRLTRQAILLKDLTQALEALYLDLPYPLTGQTDLQAYVLQGTALMAAQAEAANHHFTLLVRELRQPLVNALGKIIVLQQFARIRRTIIRQGVQQGFIRLGANA